MRATVLFALAMLTTGCGFQLRGSDILPPDLSDLYVQAPGELKEEIETFLEGSSTRLLDRRDGANIVLTVANPRYDRRVLSVDPNTGKEREFELSYTLDFNAMRTDGNAVLPPQTMTLLRNYIFDRDAVLGASREEGVLRIEMRRDAVVQILSRLQAATRG